VTIATIDITAANHDVISHATAAGILGLSVTGTIPLAPSSAAGYREQPQAVGVTQRAGWSGRLIAAFLVPLRDQGAGAWGLREKAQAVIGPVVEPCAVSGSISSSFDDRDGNTVPSVSDVITIAFDNCRDSPDETVNGNASATISMVNVAPLGSTTPVRTISTVQGSFKSNRAGGVVEVATVSGASLIKYDAEAYPQSGVVQVKGKNSTLLITALSANDVKLDLDADNNGSFESTSTVTRDWLL
jgi:hypothetical protein